VTPGRRLAVCAAALAVIGALFVVTAPAGRAAGALQAAWWWQAESSTGAVPAPPTVPDGGLWVSSDAAGPQALSAIRVPLGPGDVAPTLVLTVHAAAPPGAVRMAAYPTTSAWTPGPAQAWSAKPAYDPKGVTAVGDVSSDGKHVTFDLSALVAGDQLNVILAPAPAAAPPPPPVPAPPPGPPTFDVTFEKPDARAFRVQGAPVAPAASPEPTAAAAPAVDLGTAIDSFTPTLPSGLVAPPLAAPSAPATVARPPVALRNVPRRIVAASARRSFADSAALAAMLGIVLLWLAREGGSRLSGPRRPRLTLYDAPKQADAAVARVGSPPALR
jgi:hypothetical protein